MLKSNMDVSSLIGRTETKAERGESPGTTRESLHFRGDTAQESRAWLISILTGQPIDGLTRLTATETLRIDRKPNQSVLPKTTMTTEPPRQLTSPRAEIAKVLILTQTFQQQQRFVGRARHVKGFLFAQITENLNPPRAICRRQRLHAVEGFSQALEATP